MAKKLTEEEWFKRNVSVWNRKTAIDLLLDRHKLRFLDVYMAAPEEVRARQERYERDFNALKEKWIKEDEAFDREYGLDEAESK